GQRRLNSRARRGALFSPHGAGRAPREDPPSRPRAGRGAAAACRGDEEAPRAEQEDLSARKALSAAGAFDLIRTFEEEKARALGISARRQIGMYYTPPQLASEVVELALRFHHGPRASVLDPCAGAGAFLVAAA